MSGSLGLLVIATFHNLSLETLHGNSNFNSQPAPLANGATHGTLRNLAWELKFQSPRCPPGQRSLTQNPQKPCMGIKIPIANLAPWPTEPYTEHSETVHAKSNSNAQPGPLTSGALHGTLKNPAWELKFQFPTCPPGQRSLTRNLQKPCMEIEIPIPNLASWPTGPYTEPSETLP